MALQTVVFVSILAVVLSEVVESNETNYISTTESAAIEVQEEEYNDANETLIWEEEFDTFDCNVWSHLITAWDGGNREFQYYRKDKKNSFVADGILNIRPTPTVDEYSESFLENGTLKYKNCNMQPCSSISGDDIVSPYFSARLSTRNGFAFKYGRVEIKAKMPKGDWLWPAIWMLPESNKYGGWPRSGEIDIVEVRSNPDLKDPSGKQHGYTEVGSTLHFGPAHYQKVMMGGVLNAAPDENFSDTFHIYEMRWTKESFIFMVDGRTINKVVIPDGGFTELGDFATNIWENGQKDAPFDSRFHFVLNVAVGGNFFPDDWSSDGRKRPYDYNKKGPKRQFWSSQPSWIKTWGERPEDHSMQVDYIRVYQSDEVNFAFGED